MGEHYVIDLYELFGNLKIKPNIVQTGAISILCCLDDRPDKIEKLAHAASTLFEVSVEKNLSLLYHPSLYSQKKSLMNYRKIKPSYSYNRTTDTVQALLRS